MFALTTARVALAAYTALLIFVADKAYTLSVEAERINHMRYLGFPSRVSVDDWEHLRKLQTVTNVWDESDEAIRPLTPEDFTAYHETDEPDEDELELEELMREEDEADEDFRAKTRYTDAFKPCAVQYDAWEYDDA